MQSLAMTERPTAALENSLANDCLSLLFLAQELGNIYNFGHQRIRQFLQRHQQLGTMSYRL